MYDAFNATFVTLIPKYDNPKSFNYFWPISICNYIYKIIVKIFANRIKPILSQHISQEQFSFLISRMIYEAIGISQEDLHSLKINKLKGMVFKIDPSKVFDRTCWLYLRLLLTHLGFPHEFILWIICCLSSVSYNFLINGSTSNFLHAKRALRQGCPLSPLLFLLFMEGLSRLITEEKLHGILKGIKIVDNVIFSHSLFVDDVIIFLNGPVNDSTYFNVILNIFYKAT